MKCQNCGYEAGENDKFCPNCGNPLESIDQEPKEVSQEATDSEPVEAEVLEAAYEEVIEKEQKKKKFFDDPTKITILAAILYFNLPIFLLIPGTQALTPISFPCSMVGFAFLIYTRVKFPQYKPAKVLLWIAILMLILMVILIIWLFITCIKVCEGLQGCPG